MPQSEIVYVDNAWGQQGLSAFNWSSSSDMQMDRAQPSLRQASQGRTRTACQKGKRSLGCVARQEDRAVVVGGG